MPRYVERFNDLLDQATDPGQSEADYGAIREISYMIDKGIIESADVVQSIFGKLVDENPQTVIFALKVLEIVFYKCGNLVHSVVCTKIYMDLLEEIIDTTEHDKVKQIILGLLTDWTEKFKYFPNYCEPENLLKRLKEGKEERKMKNIQIFDEDSNEACSKDTSSHVNLNGLGNSKVNEKVEFNASQNKFEAALNKVQQTEEQEFKDKEDDFKATLAEIQRQKKQAYKKHRKSLGLPTSSDEEDAVNKENTRAGHKITDQNINKTSKSLPKELEKCKKQRLQLDAACQEVRTLKHEEFLQNSCNPELGLSQCTDKNCVNCKKYKKPKDEEQKVIPKQLIKEMRKVKESRIESKNSFEEYKLRMHEAHKNKTTNIRSSLGNNFEKDYIESENEDKDLERALFFSQLENAAKASEPPRRVGDRQEDQELERALSQSLLETGNPNNFSHSHINDDDDLQQAIDLSFAEEEGRQFSKPPKCDEESVINYVKKLSLDETNPRTASALDGNRSHYGLCYICYEDEVPLRMFKPCNHTCICHDCVPKYNSLKCIVCQEYYTYIAL